MSFTSRKPKSFIARTANGRAPFALPALGGISSILGGRYENTSFDSLRYTFRRRLCKNSRCSSLFVSFTPTASKVNQKAMRRKIRKLGIRMRTDLNIAQLSGWLNPMLSGWLAYYGRFCRSALYSVFRHFNKALVRWVRRKHKPLRHHKTRASKLLEDIAKRSPRLLAHWRAEMVGAFA